MLQANKSEDLTPLPIIHIHIVMYHIHYFGCCLDKKKGNILHPPSKDGLESPPTATLYTFQKCNQRKALEALKSAEALRNR